MPRPLPQGRRGTPQLSTTARRRGSSLENKPAQALPGQAGGVWSQGLPVRVHLPWQVAATMTDVHTWASLWDGAEENPEKGSIPKRKERIKVSPVAAPAFYLGKFPAHSAGRGNPERA